MGITTKTRVGTTASLKAKKQAEGDHFLLARGLSARYCGANTPLTGLSAEEMERDLRHMEAYANACTAYAQQYYIYQNKRALENEDKKTVSAPLAQPLIAMPVRIDPEEEKRLTMLRQKIQQCEGQREVLESQYLSLRAHYVYLSQKLKNVRKSVNGKADFLQELAQKRSALIALQRARLQMSREVLSCLQYRQQAKLGQDDGMTEGGDHASEDLVEMWNQVDEQFKKAEQACRSGNGAVEDWGALKVPTIPPGVPLYLSQLAKAPGFAAAWGTGGMFGSKSETLCWLEDKFHEEVDHRGKELPALREEVDFLQQELNRERTLNKELQTGIIARRKRNDELVAMMALLRTETEAVIARHNILLESDQAKDAAYKLHQEEEEEAEEEALANHQESGDHMNLYGDSHMNHKEENNETFDNINHTNTPAEDKKAVDTPLTSQDTPIVAKEDGELQGKAGEIVNSNAIAAGPGISKVEDNENDGDDEGEVGEEDDEEEGELLEGGEIAEVENDKRGLEEGEENGSPRSKRRKL